MKRKRTPDDFAAEMTARLNERIAGIPIPERMRHLPISSKGFPVPWFVAKVDGDYDFRVVDTPKVARAVNQKLCWLCGQTLGRHMVFVIGPMCMVNRVTSEPPSHRDCAIYAARACPFLTQPRMRRNEKDLPEERAEPGGFQLDRNPGVAVVWTTLSYRPFKPEMGKAGTLFRIGLPERVEYFCQGRPATRAEVLESIESGMPFLHRVAKLQGFDAERQLDHEYSAAMKLLPAEATA